MKEKMLLLKNKDYGFPIDVSLLERMIGGVTIEVITEPPKENYPYKDSPLGKLYLVVNYTEEQKVVARSLIKSRLTKNETELSVVLQKIQNLNPKVPVEVASKWKDRAVELKSQHDELINQLNFLN